METISIKGTLGAQYIDVTIKATVDGKATAEFVVDFYNELVRQTPSFVDKLALAMPSIAKAALKCKAVAEALNNIE